MKFTYDSASIIHKKYDYNHNVLCQTRKGFRLVLNDIGDEILALLDAFSDTEDIVNALSGSYPLVDLDSLRGDINEIFRLLDLFGIVTLMESECVNSKECEQAVKYNISGDLNYKQISKFIVNAYQQNSGYFCGVVKNVHYFDAPQMRHRVMGNYEYGVFATKGDQIIAYLSVLPPKDGSVVMSISSLFFDNTLSNETKLSVFDGLLKKISSVLAPKKQVKKIRMATIKSLDGSDIINILNENDFFVEFQLENEVTIGDGSVAFYSKYI